MRECERKWTQEEIDYLTKMWGISSRTKMSKTLKRTESSISNKAYLMGLGSTRDATIDIPIIELPDITGVKYDTIYNVWIKQNNMRVRKVNKRLMVVSEKVLVDFMKTHPQLWNLDKIDKHFFSQYRLENNCSHRQEWSGEELARLIFLRENKQLSWSQIGKRLNRTSASCSCKYKKYISGVK